MGEEEVPDNSQGRLRTRVNTAGAQLGRHRGDTDLWPQPRTLQAVLVLRSRLVVPNLEC